MREWGAGPSGLMLLLMILRRRDSRSEYRLTASLLTLSSIRGKGGASIGPTGEEHRDWLDEGVEEELGEGWGVFGRRRILFKVSTSTPSRSATLVKAMESQWVPRLSSS